MNGSQKLQLSKLFKLNLIFSNHKEMEIILYNSIGGDKHVLRTELVSSVNTNISHFSMNNSVSCSDDVLLVGLFGEMMWCLFQLFYNID